MIIETLKMSGFGEEVGGGGCLFLSRYFPNGAAIWATPCEGSGMPTDDDWLMGVYGRDGDDMGDLLWSVSSDEVSKPEFAASLHSVITFAHGVDMALGMGSPPTDPAAPLVTVEVSAWKRSGDCIVVCDDEPATAHGYAVYICAPLALHVTEFEVPSFMQLMAEAHDQAKGAAFLYADDLAEMLGCKVRSQLARPLEPVSAADITEAAMCLWETALEFQANFFKWSEMNGGGVLAPWKTEFLQAWENEGTADMRWRVLGMAERCHRDWKAAVDAGTFGDSFDWEWCPEWLAIELERAWSTSHRMNAPDVNGRAMVPGDLMCTWHPFASWAGAVGGMIGEAN